MFFSRKKITSSSPLSDGVKPSDNGGSGKVAEAKRKPLIHGGAAPSRRSGSGDAAGRSVSAGPAEHGGSRATAPEGSPAAVAAGWAQAHAQAIGEREARARLAAQRSGRTWTLHADEQTRAILADCPERRVSAATAAKYRRAYDNLRASGQTALEAASTRSHWDFLRTATRFCMEVDVRTWRAASERAMKRGDLASAQRRTERAWRLATVLDNMFIQHDRRTWVHKSAEMKAVGARPVSKSKRSTRAPAPDVAAGVLLGRQQRVQERHAERLAVLALTGCRPAELRAGVSYKVIEGKRGAVLHITLHGAKWNGAGRGLQARAIQVPVDTSATRALAADARAAGGKRMLTTTDADHRSLNRALAAGVVGLSCYSFRHQQGSELKEAVSSGAMSAEEAAAAMGHASTASLSHYGSRSKARGGRKLRAMASDPVRTVPVTFKAKAAARAARAAHLGAAPGAAAPATPTPPRAAMSKPVGPLARGLRPKS